MNARLIARYASAARLGQVESDIVFDGDEQQYRYPFAIALAAATAQGWCTDAAISLLEHRKGAPVTARISLRRAAAALAGMSLQQFEGVPRTPRQWEPAPVPGRLRPWGSAAVLRGENATNPTVGLYQDRNGRWIHLHGGAPHLASRIIEVLDTAKTADHIAAAVAGWDAFELEEALAVADTCAAVARSAPEWSNHPQGRAIEPLAVVDVTADTPGELDLNTSGRPLAGIRVLDLGDGLAGPTCARTLARYGADVLQVVGPGRHVVDPFVLETGHGKRSTTLNLRDPAGVETFAELIAQAHVLCNSFRPGALDALGFTPHRLAELNHNLITVTISCYGDVGPWRDRRGWEQLAQVATGLATLAADGGPPRLAPATLCDTLTGLLAAAGAVRALDRLARAGVVGHVRASLCQTAMWITRAQVRTEPAFAPATPEFDDLLTPTDVDGGTLWHLPPADEIDGVPTTWDRPPAQHGADPPTFATHDQNFDTIKPT